MTLLRVARLVALVALVVAVAAIPEHALADQPSIGLWGGNGTYTFVNMNLTNACGFTGTVITETIVYDQTEIDYANGTQKLVEAGPNYVTYSTPYGTLTGRIAGIGETVQNPDGTLTIIGTGPSNFVTVPGSGLVRGSAGHFVALYDPATGSFTVLQDVGVGADNLPAFCTYLGPPGYQFPG
jgi:hypothetical protein